MLKHAYAVILAGGQGERFWPLSTTRRPKQLLSLFGDRPLIAAAVNYVQKLIPPQRIYIITRANLVKPTRQALPDFPCPNIIGEPVGRDTAAAITLGAACIQARDPQAVFCVLTADHLIGQRPVFQRTLKAALLAAASSSCLLTIGIKPTFPSTAFGYIEAGRRWSAPGAGRSTQFVKAKRFIEKPDHSTALGYLKTGRFFWNSGIFIWSLHTFQQALASFCPELFAMLNRIVPRLNSPGFSRILQAEYKRLKKISVDYAILEKAPNIVMAKGTFAWNDVGSWSALEKHVAADARGNVILGRAVSLDSTNNIVVAGTGLLALIGVQDLIVVRSGRATLVCSKQRAEDVKKMVELLRCKRHKDVL